MGFGAQKCSGLKWPIHRAGSGHRPKGANCKRGHKHCSLCAPVERASFGILDIARLKGGR